MLANITCFGKERCDSEPVGARNVVGFIFRTDRHITSEIEFSEPPIISEDSQDNVDAYVQYAYNVNTDATKRYTANFSHLYQEYCNVTEPLALINFLFVGLWGLIAILYT
jgi:hypothetical protein